MSALVVARSAVCTESNLGDVCALLRRCHIPAAHRSSLSQAQLLALGAAERCLEGLERPSGDHTGVLVGLTGTTAVQRRNAVRAACSASSIWSEMGLDAAAAADAVAVAFDGGAQDKIGEMASSIPARLAVAFRLRGRVLALDARDMTVAWVINHASLVLNEDSLESFLLVFVDEREGLCNPRPVKTTTSTCPEAPREGRAVAMLVRKPRPGERCVWVEDVEFTERSPEKSRRLVPGHGDARPDGDGGVTGSVRVTDAALALLRCVQECTGRDSKRTVVSTSDDGAVALIRVGVSSDDKASGVTPSTRGVTVVGTSACFAGAPDRDAFEQLSEPRFVELKDHVPPQLWAEGVMQFGRTYCVRGAMSPLAENSGGGSGRDRIQKLGQTHRAALHVCRAAIDGRARDLRGQRGIVVVATPLGVPCARLNALALNEARDSVESVCYALGVDTAMSSRILRRLLEESSDVPGRTRSSSDMQSAASVAAFVAEELGLTALPVAVEAACASSLAALDVGTRALRSGRFGYALVCGVEFPTGVRDLILCSALGMLSRTTMRPFSRRADGFLPGDGAGATLLLPDDGDPCGVRILGIGGSCDARSMLAPHAEGQRRAMELALLEAGVESASIGYIEAHGTGTVRGDVVELESTAEVYGRREVRLGTVKACIGHTFAAAGLAGLLRAESAARKGLIVGTPGLTDEERRELRERGFLVQSKTDFLPETNRGIRRTAVSAFGTGGINYHVVLEGGYGDEST